MPGAYILCPDINVTWINVLCLLLLRYTLDAQGILYKHDCSKNQCIICNIILDQVTLLQRTTLTTLLLAYQLKLIIWHGIFLMSPMLACMAKWIFLNWVFDRNTHVYFVTWEFIIYWFLSHYIHKVLWRDMSITKIK